MIKKILISLGVLLAIGFGVWKIFFNNESISNKLEDVRNELNSYSLEANMELYNGEEKREFNVNVSYVKKDDLDYFKVSLFDKTINKEQVLLRNNEGVYVLTPSLNQVYSFKSGWPLNSAKPYVYQSLLEVFNGDYDLEKVDDGYIITSNLDYKNSPNYVRQEVKFSKDFKPVWVNIYNDKEELVVKINFTKVETNVSFDDEYFNMNNVMEKAREGMDSNNVSKLNELPLFVTSLEMNVNLKDNVEVNYDGDMMIMLVYEGDANFTVIEKECSAYSELSLIESDGEIILTMNGFAILEDYKVSYNYNDISVEIYGDSLLVSTYFDIANGMEVVGVK